MPRLLALLPLATLAWALPARAAECLLYGPTVTLTGRLRPEVFPGPSEFESVAKGDEPLWYWILHLDTPVCVTGGDGAVDVPEQDVQSLQLVFMDVDAYRTWRHLSRRRVVAQGTLFHAITAYHVTKVLLSTTDLAPAPATP